MTADELDPMPPMVVEEAVRRALLGDVQGGGMLLVPLIEEGRRSCYALCAMLAQAALIGAQPMPGDCGMFRLEIEDDRTGELGSPEDLPPDVAFAAQFVAAWANEDQDGALALFDALCAEADTEAGMGRVVCGVLALFGMAVATAAALVEQRLNNPDDQQGQTR